MALRTRPIFGVWIWKRSVPCALAAYCDEGWQVSKWARVQLTETKSRSFEISGCLLIYISCSKLRQKPHFHLTDFWRCFLEPAPQLSFLSINFTIKSEIKQLNVKLFPVQHICISKWHFTVASPVLFVVFYQIFTIAEGDASNIIMNMF